MRVRIIRERLDVGEDRIIDVTYGTRVIAAGRKPSTSDGSVDVWLESPVDTARTVIELSLTGTGMSYDLDQWQYEATCADSSSAYVWHVLRRIS